MTREPFTPLVTTDDPRVDAAWARANKEILWGWKRDVGPHSRVVFYSGRLERRGSGVGVTGHFLFYKHRTDEAVVESLAETFEGGRRAIEGTFGPMRLGMTRSKRGTAVVE